MQRTLVVVLVLVLGIGKSRFQESTDGRSIESAAAIPLKPLGHSSGYTAFPKRRVNTTWAPPNQNYKSVRHPAYYQYTEYSVPFLGLKPPHEPLNFTLKKEIESELRPILHSATQSRGQTSVPMYFVQYLNYTAVRSSEIPGQK